MRGRMVKNIVIVLICWESLLFYVHPVTQWSFWDPVNEDRLKNKNTTSGKFFFFFKYTYNTRFLFCSKMLETGKCGGMSKSQWCALVKEWDRDDMEAMEPLECFYTPIHMYTKKLLAIFSHYLYYSRIRKDPD